MEHLLGTDSRNPPAKHRILEMYVEHGFEPPDTPVMALHRGRIDLLEAHLARDPDLLTRTFDIADVFPLAPACAREPYTAQGTPVHGTTLLHIAAYFDELEIAEWLLDRGMDPDARAAIDADGFGGYTALFSTVVSQRNFWVNYGKGQPDEARFTRLLLDRGADPNVRASLRARLEEGHGGGPLREYRDVTPLGWGERYDAQDLREPRVAAADRGAGRRPLDLYRVGPFTNKEPNLIDTADPDNLARFVQAQERTYEQAMTESEAAGSGPIGCVMSSRSSMG